MIMIIPFSSSMEECEALCTRIAIMVNGQFKCMGSTQHLKTRFGEGYTLIAKVSGEDITETDKRTSELRRFIESRFENCSLKDIHHGLVHYHIKDSQLSWAKIFGTIERAQAEYGIEDYSISQTTLEQVFLNFARKQEPPVISDMGCGTKCCNGCRLICCGCCSNSSV